MVSWITNTVERVVKKE